jgi:hypothetical protein
MFKLLRRIFASLVPTSESNAGKNPYVRTPWYMAEVEDNLDRYFGMKIERRNQHIPTLAPNQFDRDLGSTRSANSRARNPRRIADNNDYLSDGAASPPRR